MQHRVDETVPEAERGRRELVVDARVYGGIVATVGAELGHAVLSDHQRQPVRIGDVLHRRAHDLACLVVQSVAVPARVDAVQCLGEPVVLAHPHHVHRREPQLLIDADVPGGEAIDLALVQIAPAVHTVGGCGEREQRLLAGEVCAVPQQPTVGGKVTQLARKQLRVAVHLRCVDERRQLVDLFAWLHTAEEDGRHAGTADGTRAHKVNAAPVVDARIVRRHVDRVARGGVLARFLAVHPVPALGRHRGDGVVEIVIEELTPLHHHVRDAVVRCDGGGRDQAGRDKPGARFRVAVVLRRPVPSDRTVEAVLVRRRQQPLEAGQRGAPGRVLRIVARSVQRTEATVEAPLRAVRRHPMRHATRQLLQQVQILRRQEIPIAEVGAVGGQVSACLHLPPDDDQRSLVHFRCPGQLPCRARREANDAEQITMVPGGGGVRSYPKHPPDGLINRHVHLPRCLGNSDAYVLVTRQCFRFFPAEGVRLEKRLVFFQGSNGNTTVVDTYFTASMPLAVARPYLFSSEHSYRPTSSSVMLEMNRLPADEMRYLSLSFGVMVRPSFCHLI
uniref:Uncharacterized protein n=1 Tax=Anopheles atroparvus TaxID=41427 RepID=A0AAG5DEV3_ANOAO